MAGTSDIDYANVDIEHPKFNVNTSHWVHITHIVDPHNFYVRRTEHFKIIKSIEAREPSSKPTSWNIGDVIIINLKTKNKPHKYARGKIMYTNMNQSSSDCDIFMLDYGYLMKAVPICNIWKCDQEIAVMPPLAVNCQLGYCAPLDSTAGWTEKSIEAFKYYVGDERARMKILDKTVNQLVVELVNSCPDDIAKLLALTGYSTFGYVGNDLFLLM